MDLTGQRKLLHDLRKCEKLAGIECHAEWDREAIQISSDSGRWNILLGKGSRNHKCYCTIEIVRQSKGMVEAWWADCPEASLPLVIVGKEVFYVGKTNRADKCLRLREECIYAVGSG